MRTKDRTQPVRARRASNGEAGILAYMNVTVVNVIIAVAAIALFMGYLAMSNVAAATGYRIRAAERSIADLQDQKKKLDLKVVEQKAMQHIESQVADLGLVPVSDIDYLGIGGSEVAVR